MELSSANNFRDYFRGLYFKTEAVNEDGTLMMLDLQDSDAGVTLYYTNQEEDAGSDETTDVAKSYKLNLGPNKVNTFEQDTPVFTDDNLYLKGGEGSMAIIELFGGNDSDGDGVSEELEDLRKRDWLINEANLMFYVNQEELGQREEPKQVYLYDLDNNRILADYELDTSGEENEMTSNANRNHLVPLERDDDGNAIRYKVRITNHINRILNQDADNVKLGLVVSQNVNEITNAAVRGSEEPDVKRVPVSSVISPEGTVLYGPEAVDEDKRLKLRIYYTESKE